MPCRFVPRYLDALDSRGFVNLKLGQASRAIADYDQALQINLEACTGSLWAWNGQAADRQYAQAGIATSRQQKPFSPTSPRNSLATACADSQLKPPNGRMERNMSANRNGLKLVACVTLAAGLALPAGIGLTFAAEQPSAEQIIKALKPPRVTRSLSTTPADTARDAEETRFIDTLRNRTTRSLTTDERDKVASIAKSKPSIDLEITFEFNSATIAANAMPQVTALGEALTSCRPEGSHLHPCRAHRRQGQRHLQSEPVGAARGCGEALPGGKVQDRSEQSGDGRVRQDCS